MSQRSLDGVVPVWPPRRVQPVAFLASVFLHALVFSLLGRVSGSPSSAPVKEADATASLRLVQVAPSPVSLPPSAAPAARQDVPAAPPPLADTATAVVHSPAIGRGARGPGAVPGAGATGPTVLRDARLLADAIGRRLLFEQAATGTMTHRFEQARQEGDAATASADSAALARRQALLFGRRVTVFGDSDAAGWSDLTAVGSGARMVMPTDGREWENLEMQRQSADFVRDSILRERIRASSARRDAALRSGQE